MGLEERAKEKEIEGLTYKVTPVPSGVGRSALMRLIGILSPILEAAFKDGGTNAGAIFGVLPEALTDADVAYFSDLFGKYSEYTEQGSSEPTKLMPAVQDLHWAGNYLAMFRWLVFAIEVNFGGFFTGIMSSGDVSALLKTMTGKKAA